MERSAHPGDWRVLSFGVFILFPGELKEQWDYKEKDGINHPSGDWSQ